jgi:hypothetical protein
MKKNFAYFLFLICVFFGQNAFATEDNLQMYNTASKLEGKAFGAHTNKEVFNHFIEKPLSKKTSIGAINQASHTSSNHNGGTSAYAINSIEIFHRYKIFSGEKLGIIIHNSFKPRGIYNENKYLALMPKQDDYELRFLFAYNMKDRLVNTVTRNQTPFFFRAETAYRRKFSNPFDEARFKLLAGLRINEKFSLLAQDDINWLLKSKPDETMTTTTSPGISKQANHSISLSLIYHLNRNIAIQAGYMKRLNGVNPFYDDRGATIGVWNSF